MRLKSNFVLRNVAGSWVVLPIADQALDFNGMLTLNQSGVLLWRALEQGGNRTTLASALTDVYDVSFEEALADVNAFLQKLYEAGCIEES